MGFAVELLVGFKQQFGDVYDFSIWTDSPKKVEDFFLLHTGYLPKCSILPIWNFGLMRKSKIAFSLFHTPIPKKAFFATESLILRIDYLSFDSDWLHSHGKEHISSSLHQKVIEIIPSPLLEGAWLLPVSHTFFSRSFLAKKFWLHEEKKWIPIFCYPETFSHLDYRDIPNGFEFLIFWKNLPRDLSSKLRKDDSKIHPLQFVDIVTWQSFIRESEWALLRWEVSASAGLSLGKLGFWDMYKQIGWYNWVQGNDFCNFFDPSPEYKDIHLRLNGQKKWWVCLSELLEYRQSTKIKKKRTKNLIEEIKKHIDRYEISI